MDICPHCYGMKEWQGQDCPMCWGKGVLEKKIEACRQNYRQWAIVVFLAICCWLLIGFLAGWELP